MGSIQSSSPLSSPFQVGRTDSKDQTITSMKTGGENLSKLNKSILKQTGEQSSAVEKPTKKGVTFSNTTTVAFVEKENFQYLKSYNYRGEEAQTKRDVEHEKLKNDMEMTEVDSGLVFHEDGSSTPPVAVPLSTTESVQGEPIANSDLVVAEEIKTNSNKSLEGTKNKDLPSKAKTASRIASNLIKTLISGIKLPVNIVAGTLSALGTGVKLIGDAMLGSKSKSAGRETIAKHKESKQSQLKVESQNLRLALKNQGFSPDKVDNIVQRFEDQANQAILENFGFTANDIKTADDLINNAELCGYDKFAETRFMSENLEFMKALQQLPDPLTENDAQQIVNNFIKEDSKTPINISHDQRTDIENALKDLSEGTGYAEKLLETLNVAGKEVKGLIQSNDLANFKNSEEFKTTMRDMTNKELSSATKSIRKTELSPKEFLKTLTAEDLGVEDTKLQETQKEIETELKSTRSKALDDVGKDVIGESGLTKEIEVDGKKITTTIKPRSAQFVSSHSNDTDLTHCGNLHKQEVEGGVSSFRSAALTVNPELQESNLSVSGSEDTVGSLAGKFTQDTKTDLCNEWGFKESDIPENPSSDKKFMKKLTRKVALRNKAIELVSEAAKDAKAAGKDSLNLTSLSLMTPDRPRAWKDQFKGKGYGEIRNLRDQREAFELIRSMSTESKANNGITGVNIMDFNFGVNEGESLGRLFQAEKNKESMKMLADTTKASIKENNKSLETIVNSESKEFKELQAKIAMQEALLTDIKTKFDEFNDFQSLTGAAKGKGAWKADKAYDLTSKIATLTSLNGDQNHCNCASGKDRTGMHMALSISNDQLIQEQLKLKAQDPDHKIDTRTTSEKIDDLNFELNNPVSSRTKTEITEITEDIKKEQKRNLAIILDSGQKEVQKANTGSEGYKLLSDIAANWFTGGGQTEAFFEKLTGLTKEQVANQIVGDGKHNET
ncbi:hypothetical protein DID76_02240 [Candidatus Marinamargulisbacteria bacterium SCGC AG-414-C22]|nr:hypothetical protein DID76_02240 [Candidatus Marinamargulisbacteria bacterium SCGC AG-414-C22]